MFVCKGKADYSPADIKVLLTIGAEGKALKKVGKRFESVEGKDSTPEVIGLAILLVHDYI